MNTFLIFGNIAIIASFVFFLATMRKAFRDLRNERMNRQASSTTSQKTESPGSTGDRL